MSMQTSEPSGCSGMGLGSLPEKELLLVKKKGKSSTLTLHPFSVTDEENCKRYLKFSKKKKVNSNLESRLRLTPQISVQQSQTPLWR